MMGWVSLAIVGGDDSMKAKTVQNQSFKKRLVF
jgi:hypothetical protein